MAEGRQRRADIDDVPTRLTPDETMDRLIAAGTFQQT